ncbi:hypothetical protein ACE1SV_59550 [Streptomyces sp. E-15]
MPAPRLPGRPVRRLVRPLIAALALLPAPLSPAAARAAPGGHPARFDLQAHRGGLGLTTEESLEGFGKAMRLGVSTLELDAQVTRDLKVASVTTGGSAASSAGTPAPPPPVTRGTRTSASTSRT